MNFDDIIKEYRDTIKGISIEELENSNKVLDSDIELREREMSNLDSRISELESILDGIDQSDYLQRQEITNNLVEVNELKNKREHELKEFKEKRDKQKETIDKANKAEENAIEKAEEQIKEREEEIKKEIEELKDKKGKFGIEIRTEDGKTGKQLTPEEKLVIEGIDKEIESLEKEIEENKKLFKKFKMRLKQIKLGRDEKETSKKKDKEADEKETNGKEQDGKAPDEKEPEGKAPDEKEPEGKEPDGKETDGKEPEGKELEGKEPDGKEPDGKEPKGKEPDGKEPDGKEPEGKEPDGKEPDGKESKGKEPDGKEPKGKEPNEKEPEGKESEIDYNKMLAEYKKILEAYKIDLQKLYNLQQQYENGEIDYSQYQEHAGYMSEKYDYVLGEYKKVLDEYNKLNKEKPGKENPEKNPNGKWHPDLTEEQIDYIKSELDIYEPEGQEYEQALRQLGLDPNKYKGEEEKNSKPQWHPDLTEEQIDYIKSELDIYEPEGQEYEQALRQLGIDPNKYKGAQENNLEKPEEPEQPRIIDERGKDGQEEPVNNLPIRSFWEIYNSTCTEHANNFAIKVHNFAHMKILPSKNEDTVTKVLSAPLIPLKAVMKWAAILPNKLMKTDEKLEEMQENIDSLSPEEFQVLISSSDKANKFFGKHVKDQFDKDYLDPQFMKQYKVNELYLKAVGGRLSRERIAAIDFYNQQVNECEEKIKELDEEMQTRELTLEEKVKYNRLTEDRQECIDIGTTLREEIDTFNDGVKKKSSGFKNISGWFLGKFNPDNREHNEEMAKISKERREIAESTGDRTEINKLTNKMSDYAKQQTDVRGKGNDTRDIGVYSIEGPIEMLDKGQENRGRLLLTDVAIIASAIDLAKQVANAKNMQTQIDNHNAEIAKANDANKDIDVSGQVRVSDATGGKEAQEALARQTVEGTFNRSERANLDANDWNLSSQGYKAGDAITHAEAQAAAKAVTDAINRGDSEGALKIAMEYAGKNAAKDEAAINTYMNANPQFDYTAVNFGAQSDMKTLTDFFNGSIDFNTTVTGTMVSTLQNMNNGVSPLAAIFAGANAMHQAQKQGVEKGLREAVKVDTKPKEEPNKGNSEEPNKDKPKEEPNKGNSEEPSR